MTDNQISVSVLGLGKLGCPMAAVFASKGFHVIGADSDPEKVKAVRESKAPTYEPGLQELIGTSGDHLTATTDVAEAVSVNQTSGPETSWNRFTDPYVRPHQKSPA